MDFGSPVFMVILLPTSLTKCSVLYRAHCSHGLNGEQAEPVAPGEVRICISCLLPVPLHAQAQLLRESCIEGGIGIRAGRIPD